jgi:hypothetical protein
MRFEQSFTDKRSLELVTTEETPVETLGRGIGTSDRFKLDIHLALGIRKTLQADCNQTYRRHLVHLDALDNTIFGLDLTLDVFGQVQIPVSLSLPTMSASAQTDGNSLVRIEHGVDNEILGGLDRLGPSRTDISFIQLRQLTARAFE